LIGAGRIAAGYDTPASGQVLTHAHAITAHPEAVLSGFWDPSGEAAVRAVNTWGGTAYHSLRDLLDGRPDVVVICAPDGHHERLLRDVLDHPPQLVVCEKPMTLNAAASSDLVRCYEQAGVGLLVNYQRRLDPVVRAFVEASRSGSLGRLLCGSLAHSKGIKHNGSHGVDLLRLALGEPHAFTVTGHRLDYDASDPTVSAVLEYEDAEIAVLAGDERAFSLFEIDLVFERARYRFHTGGLRLTIQRPRPDPVYPGYLELQDESCVATGFVGSLGTLVQLCRDRLVLGGPTLIDAGAVLMTQKLCEALASAPLHRRTESVEL
jgi:predicted dehydrogenase